MQEIAPVEDDPGLRAEDEKKRHAHLGEIGGRAQARTVVVSVAAGSNIAQEAKAALEHHRWPTQLGAPDVDDGATPSRSLEGLDLLNGG
jgi:hypothetical protein